MNATQLLLIQPDDVSITVRVEPFDGLRTGLVETLPSTSSGRSKLKAQGERFIVHKAESIKHFDRLAEAPGAVPRLRLAGLEKPNFNPFG
jgi:hypothetical protein